MNPTAGLPLFAPPVPAYVRHIQGRMAASHAAFIENVRCCLAGAFAGSGKEISTDNAWKLMEHYSIKLPEGASPNILGSLFSAWDRATPMGFTRSKRAGSHGNLLRTWTIT